MNYAEIPKMEEDGIFIGATIKRIRKASGITLRQIQAATGISNSYLSQLETGKIKKPSYDTVSKLNSFFANLPKKKDACPLCRSEDYTTVGTMVPARGVMFEAMCCNKCGVLFRIKSPQ